MSKHHEGPFSVGQVERKEYGGPTGGRYGTVSFYVVNIHEGEGSRRGNAIASVSLSSAEETLATAHLLAAAPELLEALETAAIIIHTSHSIGVQAPRLVDCPDSVCRENCAALRKARGES